MTGVPIAEHPGKDRRQAVRLDAVAQLTVKFSDQRFTATVANIGLGGLGLEVNLPIRHGATYGVRLQTGKFVVNCDAAAAHCRRRPDGVWLVGMTFVRNERLGQLERLVEVLTRSRIRHLQDRRPGSASAALDGFHERPQYLAHRLRVALHSATRPSA